MPIKTFTISDGLAHNNIHQIFQDAKGYLWIATAEGLSRFDGYGFKNYGKPDGLGGSYINDVTADRNGGLWVAINDGGIARLLDEPSQIESGKKFVSYSISTNRGSNNAGRILFDAENRMWCATEGGIFRARSTEVADGDFDLIAPDAPPLPAREAFIDRPGRLWFGLNGRILKVADGETTYYELESLEKGDAFISGITEDQNGNLFASTNLAVYEFAESGSQWQKVGLLLSKNQTIRTINRADDGGLWIGTNAGLIHYVGGRQTLYSTENGLASDFITAIYTDRDNRLWLGILGGGLSNRSNNAVVSFNNPQRSQSFKSYRLETDHAGNVFVQTGCLPDPVRLVKIADLGVSENPSPGLKGEDCRKNKFFHDKIGRRWLLSEHGLTIFDEPDFSNGLAVTLPVQKRIDTYVEIYQDKHGKIWLSGADQNLYVANGNQPGTPRFEIAAHGVKASLMLLDSRDTLWLANNIFLGRLRKGDLVEIEKIDAVESITPRALFEDSNGRIWIGTRFDGVLFTDEPDAERPHFKKISTTEGLASNSVWAIAEDDAGGIYLGTGRGVDRYEIETGRIRHFTSADGISQSAVNHLLKDKKGRIWVASDSGVSRIDPSALDQDPRPPPVFISRILIAGEELPLAESGVSSFTSQDLSAGQNNVSIQFVGLNLKGEHSLNYQYKLEGYDKDWSQPGKQREVNLANLGSGSYRFLVRAIDQQGVQSESPAVFQFQILPPVWQRWWFLALVGFAVACVLYSFYRYRLSRVVELERVRTRIATDLHDDIGSNLTRIALMSEVLNQQGSNGSSAEMLPSIANIARESVASMNDIVWAISPEHDRVLDLTRRMRQHAEEVFTIRDIDLAFVSGSSDSELKLTVGVRRDVLLIFKEAVNNAARHSGCTKVEIDFGCTSSSLNLRVADNGCGFQENPERDGHGLSSMARRADSLGGKLTIRSGISEGTTVNFEMPLR
jgi:ligand-binding sensor domain-containing protein/two-component sensor histidine kinase